MPKKQTVSVQKEIYCSHCRKDYSLPLEAILNENGWVRYFRDAQEHRCPFCKKVDDKKERGILVLRFRD